ncbi:MAG: DUF1592 domain-containing protein [Bdellovibrionales bacterium]
MHQYIRVSVLAIGIATLVALFQNCGGAMHASKNSNSTGIGSTIDQKSCGSNYSPGLAPLRLLSNFEYDNTVKDLLFTTTVASDAAIFEETAPGPTGFFSDTSAVPLTLLRVEKYWSAAGKLADEIIATKSASNSSYGKIAACAVGRTNVPASCYASVVRELGKRAFRRPLTEFGSGSEYARYLALMQGQSSFDEGLRTLIQGLLMDPNFLFIPITSTASRTAGATFGLDPFQLATRLSYFLWQTMPDDQLMSIATNGSILSDATLNSQIDRMLKDPKAQRLTETMMRDWAMIRDVEGMQRSGLTESLRQSMITEVQMMFGRLISEDASLQSILTGNSSYLNKELADHYGVPFSGSSPTQFTLTNLSSVPRRGIFGTGLFLALSAKAPEKTSVVGRGKAVANQFGCFEVPPPPDVIIPDADAIAALPPNPTPSEFLAAHRTNPVCASCHNTLDPYGLAFETFDVLGKWRTTYDDLGGKVIDQAGLLPTGQNYTSTADMMNLLGQSEVVKNCSVRKVMSIAVARKMSTADDRCASEAIGALAMKPTAKFSDLIKGIANSRTFKFQTGEGL